jgi:hypothetical protein
MPMGAASICLAPSAAGLHPRRALACRRLSRHRKQAKKNIMRTASPVNGTNIKGKVGHREERRRR